MARVFRQLYKVEQRHRHSSCADEPCVTPPPGLVAEAKFSTHTCCPMYCAAASKERFFVTMTDAFSSNLGDGTANVSVSRISFCADMDCCCALCNSKSPLIRSNVSSKTDIRYALRSMFLFVCVVNGAKVQKKSDIHKDFIQKNAKRVDFPPRKHPENRKFHPKPPQK